MAEGGLSSGAKVGIGMVAAAGPILLPAQEMTLRGSLATQSLTAAADAVNEVVQLTVGEAAQAGAGAVCESFVFTKIRK